MPNIQLANNLRYLRKQCGLTQTTLSDMLNISRQAYSNYETSKRTPDLDSLLLLSSFYQVNLDALVLKNLQHSDTSGILSEDPAPYALASEKKTGNTIYLSEEEIDMIIQYRTLSHENQQIITGFLRANSEV